LASFVAGAIQGLKEVGSEIILFNQPLNGEQNAIPSTEASKELLRRKG
jgi:hypothetical protein